MALHDWSPTFPSPPWWSYSCMMMMIETNRGLAMRMMIIVIIINYNNNNHIFPNLRCHALDPWETLSEKDAILGACFLTEAWGISIQFLERVFHQWLWMGIFTEAVLLIKHWRMRGSHHHHFPWAPPNHSKCSGNHHRHRPPFQQHRSCFLRPACLPPWPPRFSSCLLGDRRSHTRIWSTQDRSSSTTRICIASQRPGLVVQVEVAPTWNRHSGKPPNRMRTILNSWSSSDTVTFSFKPELPSSPSSSDSCTYCTSCTYILRMDEFPMTSSSLNRERHTHTITLTFQLMYVYTLIAVGLDSLPKRLGNDNATAIRSHVTHAWKLSAINEITSS